MSNSEEKFVLDTINSNKVVIFSKTHCPYCKQAKEQFQKLNYSYFVVELDKRSDGDTIQNILKNITGAKTVPRVFIDGNCIGGGTDVENMYKNGSLKQLLGI